MLKVCKSYIISNLHKMLYIIAFILIIFVIVQLISILRGWNGNIHTLPAYNLSLIRQYLNQKNSVLLQNFLTEEAKQEYDSIYTYLEETQDKNSDIILENTTIDQISECMESLPSIISSFTGKNIEYVRIVNTDVKHKKTKHYASAFCTIQPCSITLYHNKKNKTVAMNSGDMLILPRGTEYSFHNGTIDCFSYFK